MSEVIASYRVQDNKGSLAKKAESIALGLTIGSWTDLPRLEQEQLERHKGRVVGIEPRTDGDETEGLIRIAYPTLNFSADLPALLTTVFGKLSLDGKIRWVDLALSEDWVRGFPGPQYGIDGIRSQLGVKTRPLLMSIFKGMIGKDMTEFRSQLEAQARGGVDLIKDDEISFENDLTPFAERVRAGSDVLRQVYEETGHKVLYAVNLTGRTFELRDKARRAAEAGATALLFNVFAYGLDTLQALAEDADIPLPLMAHPAVSGAMVASPDYGIAPKVLLGDLLRLAGADLVLFPSPYGSVAMERGETLAIAEALRGDALKLQPAWPVPSAGIHPGLVPQLMADFGRDCVINAGGGIHGHPAGAAAGGQAFRAAIDAVAAGRSLEAAAEEHEALRQALALWGGGR